MVNVKNKKNKRNRREIIKRRKGRVGVGREERGWRG